MPPPVAIGLAIGALGATAYSVDQSNKAAKQQREAARIESNRQEIQSARERQQAVREFRMKQAGMLNTGYQTGVSGSSGLAGGLGSLGTQLGGNLSNQTTMSAFNTASADAQSQALQYQSNAATGQAVASLAGQGVNWAGGFK
jgi:hypothetical protein